MMVFQQQFTLSKLDRLQPVLQKVVQESFHAPYTDAFH